MKQAVAVNTFQFIQLAMIEDPPWMIKFIYRSSSGTVSNRTVEPVKLQGDRLFAFDATEGERNELKQFILSRMMAPSRGDRFKPRTEHPLEIPL